MNKYQYTDKMKRYFKIPFECACGYSTIVYFDEPKTLKEANPFMMLEVRRHNEKCIILKIKKFKR